jgi:outer membrane lipoprotein-sorting protein
LQHIEQHGCDYSIRAAAFLLTLILLTTVSLADSGLSTPVVLSTDVIVQRLMAANARRSEALRGYHGKRNYRLQYHGILGSHDSAMEVEVTYTAPDRKEFKVLSQSGSKLLFNRVLFRLLSSEQDAQKTQNRTALEMSPKNYDFTLAGTEHSAAGDYYVLEANPKGKSPYLYRGKLWVDARDFAVARMQGEPAKNPSFWISHTQIEYRWAKIGDFWLPLHNQSETQVRMGGKAVLTIDYTDYQITGSNGNYASGSSGNPSMPDPSSTVDPH